METWKIGKWKHGRLGNGNMEGWEMETRKAGKWKHGRLRNGIIEG